MFDACLPPPLAHVWTDPRCRCSVRCDVRRVLQVRGRGLLNAIVVDPAAGVEAWDICLKLMKEGLLTKPTHRWVGGWRQGVRGWRAGGLAGWRAGGLAGWLSGVAGSTPTACWLFHRPAPVLSPPSPTHTRTTLTITPPLHPPPPHPHTTPIATPL